jgi:hypothetical protein
VNFSVVRKPWLILSIVMVAGAVALKYGAGGDSFEMTSFLMKHMYYIAME